VSGHGEKFGRKQEAAIAALLGQRNVEEAAKLIGVSPKTLMRWMRVPEFRAAYQEARGQLMGQANARLQQSTGAAVTTLWKLMVSPEVPASTRVRAAQCVVELAQKGFELDNLELRILQLELKAKK
jgi:transposase-like protein